MNRNVESHFAELPQVDIQRSIFDRSSSHKTSFNFAELIPFYCDEVLPGDTFKITTSAVVRLQTLLTPIMSNAYMDTYWFFIPNRLVWTHWKEFMGENTESAWLPSTEYTIPQISYPVDATTGALGWNVGTIADYMGIPVNRSSLVHMPSALPFRAYALCCDTWFRDQNLSDPLNIPLGDSNMIGSNGSNYIMDVARGGKPFLVAKYHDYFTSATKAPQKGPTVRLLNNNVNQSSGLIDQSSIYVPVKTGASHSTLPEVGMIFHNKSDTTDKGYVRVNSDYNMTWKVTGGTDIVPENLWADISQMNITINDLRVAFQLQKFFEKDSMAGTRYREIIHEHFGITTSDARMMIPEYLGGHRFPLSIHQVANQTQGETEFLGDLGAMSNTSDVHEDFTKSFEEHGILLGLCCCRYDHSYSQGLERFWSRKSRFDFYYPVMANLGNQAILKKEIYLDGTDGEDGNAFAYQECWAEYRYKPDRVSGEMRPGISNSLASWHLGDYYSSRPSFSDSWIREDKNNVDRVLAVNSNVANQVFADFYVKNICTRPMPMYSIPGLIDHH